MWTEQNIVCDYIKTNKGHEYLDFFVMNRRKFCVHMKFVLGLFNQFVGRIENANVHEIKETERLL
jgi:hypothetical protein